MANTTICSLVRHDLDGASIDQLAPRLQSTFLTLFHDNLLTYQDQYPLFGSPRVTSLKFVWSNHAASTGGNRMRKGRT